MTRAPSPRCNPTRDYCDSTPTAPSRVAAFGRCSWECYFLRARRGLAASERACCFLRGSAGLWPRRVAQGVGRREALPAPPRGVLADALSVPPVLSRSADRKIIKFSHKQTYYSIQTIMTIYSKLIPFSRDHQISDYLPTSQSKEVDPNDPHRKTERYHTFEMSTMTESGNNLHAVDNY